MVLLSSKKIDHDMFCHLFGPSAAVSALSRHGFALVNVTYKPIERTLLFPAVQQHVPSLAEDAP